MSAEGLREIGPRPAPSPYLQVRISVLEYLQQTLTPSGLQAGAGQGSPSGAEELAFCKERPRLSLAVSPGDTWPRI